jgi:hypothetical protein
LLPPFDDRCLAGFGKSPCDAEASGLRAQGCLESFVIPFRLGPFFVPASPPVLPDPISAINHRKLSAEDPAVPPITVLSAWGGA